ncbi:MAG: DUF3944 domain-containing protein [Amphritea sp.]
MAYTCDLELEFLEKLPSEELGPLVNCLTHDSDGESRHTEELTGRDLYKEHHPDHHQYWDEIAGELQCFGANSIATLFRGGKGVEYFEILLDVAKAIDLEHDDDSEMEDIEAALLMRVFEESLDKMTPEQREEAVRTMDLKTTDFSKQAILAAIQTAIRLGGFTPYKMAVIVAHGAFNATGANLVGHGLSLGATQVLTKSIAKFAGPIGWAITAAWTAYDIAGPAYRVTIPACVHIAYLRQLDAYKQQEAAA